MLSMSLNPSGSMQVHIQLSCETARGVYAFRFSCEQFSTCLEAVQRFSDELQAQGVGSFKTTGALSEKQFSDQVKEAQMRRPQRLQSLSEEHKKHHTKPQEITMNLPDEEGYVAPLSDSDSDCASHASSDFLPTHLTKSPGGGKGRGKDISSGVHVRKSRPCTLPLAPQREGDESDASSVASDYLPMPPDTTPPWKREAPNGVASVISETGSSLPSGSVLLLLKVICYF